MWYEKMLADIESEKNEEQAIKMAAYMKDNFPFLGIPKPKLDSIIKPYIKAASKLNDIDWDFKYLIITKSWWDITDGLDKVIGNLSLIYPSISAAMLEWSNSDNIWLRRVAIDLINYNH